MNCATPPQKKKTESSASPDDLEMMSTRSSDEVSPADVRLIEIIQCKLQNVSMLPMENGSPVLLSPCTQSALESLENGMKRMGYCIPRMFVESGKLYLEEYPISGKHEEISVCFDGSVGMYNSAMTGHLNNPLRPRGSADCNLKNGQKQPDAQYEVRSHPPRDCPNMVVEVAVSQTLPSLHHQCCRYLIKSDKVLIVVGVKVYEDNTAVALIYERDVGGAGEVVAPRTAISFGPTLLTRTQEEQIMNQTNVAHVSGYVEGADPLVPCDQCNLDQYVITFNHLLLLAVNRAGGEVAAEHEHAPDLVIDLFQIHLALI